MVSCKKDDISTNNPENIKQDTTKFFNYSPNTDAITIKVIQKIKMERTPDKWVPDFAKRFGYPVWEKALIIYPGKMASSFSRAVNEPDTVLYIPLVLKDSNFVNGYIKATLNDSLSLIYRIASDYIYYPVSSPTQNTRSDYALRMILLDNAVFGHNQYKFLDSSILSVDNRPAVSIKFLKDVQNTLVYNPGGICQTFDVTYTNYCHNTNTNSFGTQLVGTCTYNYTLTYCTEAGGGSGDGGNGDPTGGPTGNGGPLGGGGGYTGGGCTNCNPPPPPPGWLPLDDDPYTTNYQLTQADQDIFNEIDAEDNVSDQNHENLDCQGTKRTGNVFFQGTKEHWIIQLDYVSKHPTSGDVEYAIPGSSAAGNRGYADMVDLSTKGIFEIKPQNDAGLASAITEVTRYVDKANINCNTTMPMSLPWSRGTTYIPTLLPTGTPNEYLQTTSPEPGVVLYERVYNNNPIPAPVIVPVSVASKLSHLIDRLRQNFSQADRIIAEFMRDPANADLVSYIKTAAISAGVGIIVGTIVEDVITAGAGIADDWACFVMAYRIIRFASKIP